MDIKWEHILEKTQIYRINYPLSFFYDHDINPNQTGGVKTPTPWYILLYNFLVTHPNFMKVGNFTENLSEINILFFFKIRTGFCSVSTFSQPGVIFLYVFCWNIILDIVSRI